MSLCPTCSNQIADGSTICLSCGAILNSDTTPKNSEAPTILVIEDYPDTRELLSSLLRRKGYEVVEAENGKEGLLIASRKNPDLILMDLALPELDGVETAQRIHKVPKLSQTPIFVVSAYVTEEVMADAFAAG